MVCKETGVLQILRAPKNVLGLCICRKISWPNASGKEGEGRSIRRSGLRLH